MLKLLRDPRNAGPCILVLGMFDGVHRGHQELLMAGDELRRKYRVPLYVYTFEPHPLQTIRPELAPPLLTTLPERAALMADFGVDALCVATFTPEMRDQEPEDFMREMKERLQPKAVVCGFNFTFGMKGRGSGEMLQTWGRENGVEIVIVPNVRLLGDTVSSTRIRGLLKEGDVHQAARLMGHPYTISGEVVQGRHIGSTLGFPTANVAWPPHKLLPAYGVYAAWLTVGDDTCDAVVNVGEHPTLPGGEATVEVHVLDGSPELYGERVRVTFLRFIRRETKFASAEELSAQIRQDVEKARGIFEAMK